MTCALLVAGCVTYKEAPLDPARGKAELFGRSLTDPKLLAWLGSRGETDPGAEPATQPSVRTWDLQALSRVALYYHPDLDAARAHVAAVEAAQITAGQSPNPTVGFAPQIAQNPDGVSPWVLGLTFDIPIETAGKREDRIGQALAETDVARLELAETAWEVRSRVRETLAAYLLDGQERALLETEVALRTSYVELLEARLKAGEAARPEVNTARVDLLTARQAFRAAQGQLGTARAKLATALGMAEAGLAGAEFAWDNAGDSLDKFEEITEEQTAALQDAGLLNRIDIRRSLAEYAAAEWALRLEVAKQYPDVVISPGYEFDQGEHKWGLGVSVELPVMNRNGGPIAQAKAHRMELAAKFLALQAQVIGQIEAAQADYRGAQAEVAEADAALKATGRQVEAAQRALEAGGEDRLTVTGLQVQYAVAARLRLDAVRKARTARGAMEDAIQRPLPSAHAATLPAPAATAPATQHEDPAP